MSPQNSIFRGAGKLLLFSFSVSVSGLEQISKPNQGKITFFSIGTGPDPSRLFPGSF